MLAVVVVVHLVVSEGPGVGVRGRGVEGASGGANMSAGPLLGNVTREQRRWRHSD